MDKELKVTYTKSPDDGIIVVPLANFDVDADDSNDVAMAGDTNEIDEFHPFIECDLEPPKHPSMGGASTSGQDVNLVNLSVRKYKLCVSFPESG